MPQPPDDREKYLYAKSHLWVLTCCSVFSFGCLCLSQYRLAMASPAFWVFVPFLLLVLLDFLISLRVNGLRTGFSLNRHRKLVREWRPQHYPSVDIFLPVCGEALEILYNTWDHVYQLRENYPGLVTPYVLDDAANDEVRAMALDFGFTYGSRENRGWFKKAGNLHFGFGISEGEHILILDADFAPRPDLLNELLPYLDEDPAVGIVQSPQFFRVLDSQNWIERGAGAVQELFYRAIQVSRQSKGGAVCVGTCALYRRSALAQNGGVTLIGHSEDVYTGFDLANLGWSLRYVPVALSTGVCPDSVGAFQNQQYRWCNGSLTMMVSKLFWRSRMSFTTRLCYISGFLYYVQTALLTFATPLIPLMLLVLKPEMLNVSSIWLVLPSLVYSFVIFPLWHRAPYRLEAWSARMMYGWAHVFVIWDLLRGREMGWQPTGSNGAKTNRTRRFWLGMTIWGGGTALLWVVLAMYRMLTMYAPDCILVLTAGLFYAATVVRVLVQPRPHERAL